MELGQLRSFLAVLDEGSATVAAEVRGVSQPTLSRQIQALEDACGTALFVRSAGGMVPTRAARRLEPGAREVVTRADELTAQLAELADREVRLTAVCPVMIAEMLVLPFVAAVPTPITDVIDSLAVDAHEQVRRRLADVAFAPVTPPSTLRSCELFQVQLTLQCRPDDPMAERESVDLRELPALPLLITDARSGTRRSLDALLTARGITLRPRLEVDRTHVAQALTAGGDAGMALAIDPVRYGLTAVPVVDRGEPVRLAEWASWEPGHYAEEAIIAMLADFRDWVAQRSDVGTVTVPDSPLFTS